MGSQKHSRLLLFPGCDKRGLMIKALRGEQQAVPDIDPESLFFAWLLDLPVHVEPAAAARAILIASAVDKSPINPAERQRFGLYRLLVDTCERGQGLKGIRNREAKRSIKTGSRR